MVTDKQKNPFDDDILSFLESVSLNDTVSQKNNNLDILTSAKQYNVDLGLLEIDGNDRIYNLINQQYDDPIVDKDDVFVEDGFIEQIDVKLSDIIERVFENSQKLVVIVRDDKVVYANKSFIKTLEILSREEIVNENFLKFVDKSQWDKLAGNIGIMLTDKKSIIVNLKDVFGKLHRINLEAIYLADVRHFSFILIGEIDKKPILSSNLFDTLTGLPTFYLFEDRVQVAVNNENYKNPRNKKNMLAVVGVSIDNIAEFEKNKMREFMLQKVASKLILSLNKSYSIACGLKYQFWILVNDLQNREDLDVELKKIKSIFDEPIKDNFTEHNLNVSIGVSIFPDVAKSAKKMLEEAIKAIQISQKMGGKDMYIYLSDSDEKSE